MIDKFRSLPPLGRILLAYQHENIYTNYTIFIYVGSHAKQEAYAQARNGTLCSYLPFGANVDVYEWPIKNQKVVVHDSGGLTATQLQKICFDLMKYHPRIIYAWSKTHPCQFFNGAKR